MASAKLVKSRIAILLCLAAVLLLLSPHLLSATNGQEDTGRGAGEVQERDEGKDENLVYAKCSIKKYVNESGDWEDMKKLLWEIETKAPENKGYYKTLWLGGSGSVFYGEAKCKLGIVTEKCADCLKDLDKKIQKLCGYSLGAEVKYEDCYFKIKDSVF